MITTDYNKTAISPDEFKDLKSIADVEISNIALEDVQNLLVFPNSFNTYDSSFGKKHICSIVNNNTGIETNSIVGFVGRNGTHLSILSRFANSDKDDYFLHYMLQKVGSINLLNLNHSTDDDSIFDFLIYMFPSYLKKAVNQGIYKKYISKKYNDANVRGVMGISRHIRFNVPFNGKVAYTAREYGYDNDVTQLIRHTIEYMRNVDGCENILNMDSDMHEAVQQIVDATPSYAPNDIQNVINKNLRPAIHPYYSEYAPLQRLCLQILRHEELKFGQEQDEIYGVLIDAAWLWEEYLAIVLEGKYNHYLKSSGERFYLFNSQKHRQQLIPDYLSFDKKIVADAKYMRLNEDKWFNEEKSTAVYYKTVTYMYRFCSKQGYLFYPYPDKEVVSEPLEIMSEVAGMNGGTITKLGLRIPSGCKDFAEFKNRIQLYEHDFLSMI